MTRRKTPAIESFDPRFIQWWIDGSRTPTPVEFPTRRQAYAVRLHILYPLRKAMNATDHYAARMANRCEAVIRPADPAFADPDSPHVVIIRPVDADLGTYLERAGIRLPDSPPDSPPEDTDND